MYHNFSYNGGMVPLSLTADTPEKEALWVNPKPAGVEFLRPFLMSFEPEDENMVLIKKFIFIILLFSS